MYVVQEAEDAAVRLFELSQSSGGGSTINPHSSSDGGGASGGGGVGTMFHATAPSITSPTPRTPASEAKVTSTKTVIPASSVAKAALGVDLSSYLSYLSLPSPLAQPGTPTPTAVAPVTLAPEAFSAQAADRMFQDTMPYRSHAQDGQPLQQPQQAQQHMVPTDLEEGSYQHGVSTFGHFEAVDYDSSTYEPSVESGPGGGPDGHNEYGEEYHVESGGMHNHNERDGDNPWQHMSVLDMK